MSKLKGKVAVITGANQGIGKGIAKACAKEGASLALCARNAARLEQAARDLEADGAPVLFRPVDVTNERAVDDFFDAVIKRFGRVDILVNNAGAFDGGRIDEMTLAAWNNVLATCLTGTFLCSRRAFALMKEAGGGRILNIGSISAQRPRESSPAYAAAKFGVWGLTQATALDGREFGIVASCLHPGNVIVERRMETGEKLDDEPMMSVETIAQAALAMLTLPPNVNMLEAIVLPVGQPYLGRA